MNFDEDGNDSDTEVIINCQAHKRRKMTKDIEDLKVWMTDNMATKEQTEKIYATVQSNTARAERNEDDIREIRLSLANMEREIPTVRPNPGASYAGVASSRAGPSRNAALPRDKSGVDRDAFLLSRRRLRVWPIEGNNEDELKKATLAFCCQALGAPRKDEIGITKITRVKSAPRGIAFLEVLVEFTDNYARDDILMRGPMLSGYRDDKGKPTAGIRLDIPPHLMAVFKTLEAFGFGLKRRHPTLRKHIKFDEYAESLFIQVGLKKEGEDVDWTSYTPEEARTGLKKLNQRNGPRFDFLASPPGGDNVELPPVRRRNENVKEKSHTAYPWKPPQRQSTSGTEWRPPTRTEEDSSEEMQ